MKKFLFLLTIICLTTTASAFADGSDLPATGDIWESYNKATDDMKEAKPVSDEDFEKALESIKKKKDPIGNWIRKRQIPKGEEQSQGNESEILQEEIEVADTLPVLSLPVEIHLGEAILPVGHYQVAGEKKDDGVVLKLYQAQYLMAEIPATETQDDFNEDTISFAKWSSQDDDTIKVIFGSMDFNAYTFLKINY